MERQGHCRGFQIVSGYSFVWVVLAVLLLSVDLWAACTYNSSFAPFDSYNNPSPAWECKANENYDVNLPACKDMPACNGAVVQSGGYFYHDCWINYSGNSVCGGGNWGTITVSENSTRCHYRCTDKCSSDSLSCVNAGKFWSSEACQCADPCDNYRTQCESLGGELEGRAIPKPGAPGVMCCNATCNLCTTKASEEQWERKKYYCCQKNLAPPEMNNCAINEPPIGCGIATKFKTNSDNGNCRDPNLSEEAAQSFYENCSPGGSSSSNAESSSDGGNSSGGGSSGSDGMSSGMGPYPEGCEECPWLDSILDTLIATKGILQGVEECLENAAVCMNITPGVGDTNDYAGYLDSIIVLLDSGLANDRENIRILGSMDTTLLKMLMHDSSAHKLDSALTVAGLKNDTNIRRTLADGNYTNDTNFRSLKKAIYDLDTATIHHLDSIVKHLPDSILDSIRKYQDSALDRFDSALWGKGVGFSLIDSMIDSVVKYFQVSNHYDSAYAVMFGESMDRLMSKMDDMSFGIDANLSFTVDLDYGPLGYGDTATVTLRDDMNRMREDITNAILDIDTSVGNDLKELVEEQKGFYIFSTGYGISGSSTLKSDLAGIKGSVDVLGGKLDAVTGAVNHVDTTVKRELQNLVERQEGFYAGATGYGVSGSSTLKDDINNIAGDLVRKLDSTWSQGNADTGAVNVQIGDGNLTADSIANDYGFNKINFAADTAAVVAAEHAQLVEDSTSICLGEDCVHYRSDKVIDDSLRQRMQSASDSIVQWNEDFYRDSMDGIVDRVVRTLDSINPFGVFDSTLVKTLGMKIPNTNTCPEHCSKFKVDLPFAFGLLPMDLDFGMCTPYVVMGNQNVLSFLRFVIRCVVAVMCIGLVVTNLPRSI